MAKPKIKSAKALKSLRTIEALIPSLIEFLDINNWEDVKIEGNYYTVYTGPDPFGNDWGYTWPKNP